MTESAEPTSTPLWRYLHTCVHPVHSYYLLICTYRDTTHAARSWTTVGDARIVHREDIAKLVGTLPELCSNAFEMLGKRPSYLIEWGSTDVIGEAIVVTAK